MTLTLSSVSPHVVNGPMYVRPRAQAATAVRAHNVRTSLQLYIRGVSLDFGYSGPVQKLHGICRLSQAYLSQQGRKRHHREVPTHATGASGSRFSLLKAPCQDSEASIELPAPPSSTIKYSSTVRGLVDGRKSNSQIPHPHPHPHPLPRETDIPIPSTADGSDKDTGTVDMFDCETACSSLAGSFIVELPPTPRRATRFHNLNFANPITFTD